MAAGTVEVIANADVRQTYLELVGRENLTNHFVQGIENLRPSCSAFMVMLGVDMVPEAEPLTVVLDEEGRATQVGTLSKVDPSLAPPGHSRILLSSLIANTEAGLWDRGSPDYAERKQRYGDALIKIAEQAIPGLGRHIVLREDASPATFARYAWASDGAVYGLDMCAMRPSVKTPIQNLSIVGAGVAPRPGVEDAVRTGMKAADAIQRSTSSRPVSE
jgi:phytoene dehydrogenase-like protein